MQNDLLHHLIRASAARNADAIAVSMNGASLSYAELARQIEQTAHGLLALGLARGERVAIYLEKRFETVIASFACSAAGLVFVPVNPLLKGEQVAHILRDCNVRALISSPERLNSLADVLAQCPDLRHTVSTGAHATNAATYANSDWAMLQSASPRAAHRVIDSDMAAILYTSGSTGRPKGVVLSHRNTVTGARSVAQYLENNGKDVLLAALPLSFDAGFSQLTTAFHAGARVELLNYLMPRDVLKAVVRERVTGLTAVPPLWIQLAQLDWPQSVSEHLRYFATTGGRMPRETLQALRSRLPAAKPYLMYGLTEAFRATYLPPEEVDQRPDSIGKAIPNAEVLVLREDGSLCAHDEPGELVQRGALVALGYWNAPEETAKRFRPLPASIREAGLMLPEIAVFSGDTVRRDAEGFLYFVGRRDEMIKTSGYRVSPTEVEEAIYATGMALESAVHGIADAAIGEAIVAHVLPANAADFSSEMLIAVLRKSLPAYMLPAKVTIATEALPRNPNGKIDRAKLRHALESQP